MSLLSERTRPRVLALAAKTEMAHMIPESASLLSSTSTPKQPSEPEFVIPEKPEAWDYGYVVRNKAYGCTRKGLAEAVADLGLQITHVWIPESPEPVRPETVDFLIPGFQNHERKEAKLYLVFGIVLLAILIVVAVATSNWKLVYQSVYGVFGVVSLLAGAYLFYAAKSVTRKDLEAQVEAEHFRKSVKTVPTSIDAVVLCGVLIVVMLVQILVGEKESIEAAGLVKSAVWQGQVWRLATATLLHVSPGHFFINFFCLISMAREIERSLNPRYLMVVFLSSGILGSIFSVVLFPNTNSVGASGGILGLVGFVTVAAWQRDAYPNRYFRGLIDAVFCLAVLGIIVFVFIDHAAHAGGVLGGGLLGWVFLKSDKDRGKAVLGILSTITLVLILLSAGFTVVKLLGLW
jgi:membrane associated rhomboid family serine protease